VLVREKVNPSEVLLVGDSAGDQRATHITGVRFLARDSGLSFDAPAPLIFADLNEITHHLENLLP
jgi:phosphoglycolate phosphatase-like HAD superfamily hydrolase